MKSQLKQSLSTEAHLENMTFRHIYRDHFSLVSNVIRGFRFAEEENEDLIQETFMTAWRKLDQLKNEHALPSWLSSIARRRSLKKLKSLSTGNHAYVEDYDFLSLIDDQSEEAVNYEATLEILTECIDQHSNVDRAKVARYFYIEGRSVRNISLALQMNENTVLSHLRRFRILVKKAICELIEERGVEVAY